MPWGRVGQNPPGLARCPPAVKGRRLRQSCEEEEVRAGTGTRKAQDRPWKDPEGAGRCQEHPPGRGGRTSPGSGHWERAPGSSWHEVPRAGGGEDGEGKVECCVGWALPRAGPTRLRVSLCHPWTSPDHGHPWSCCATVWLWHILPSPGTREQDEEPGAHQMVTNAQPSPGKSQWCQLLCSLVPTSARMGRHPLGPTALSE